MAYVVGIDGGNSKTLAMVANEAGDVIGIGRGGCSNHQSVGIDAAMAVITCVVNTAMRSANIQGQTLDAAFYALAGADLPVDFDLLRSAIGASPAAPIWDVDNDVVAALRSGTDKKDAVAVVVGQGTNAIGRNAAGDEIRMPALGWTSGDWGGGGDIARAAISLSVRMWDGRGLPTALQRVVLDALGLPNVETLILHLYTRQIGEDRLLELVPLVFEVADAGDSVAAELVARQATEVAVTAITLLRRLKLLDGEPRVVLAGSIFRSESPLLMDIITDRILGDAPDAHIIIPDIEPVAGAVLCGMDLAGVTVDETVLTSIARTSRALQAVEQRDTAS